MNLIDALELTRKPLAEDAPKLRIFLACSFTPLHLQTFLVAHLRNASRDVKVEIRTGLFGDLAGNLERLNPLDTDMVVVMVEWQDLDQRLGIRSLGGWNARDLRDIVESASRAIDRLEAALKQLSALTQIRICTPTLPLPPLFATPLQQSGTYELQLRKLVASLAESISTEPFVRILNSQCLDECSAMPGRLDVQSELTAGFPYKLPHASMIAELLAFLIRTPTPKKGLITDLDDTLWAGTLGEVGPEGISWHLDHHTHIYGLYQQFLGSLASAGVLVGVASKNDAELVEQAFGREDLVICKESVYPFEVHWSPKSESVRRILNLWNIGADSVVFIDDSPMEVAEVEAAFPEMECIVFPKNHQDVLNLLKHLRGAFGKPVLTEEDSLRLTSIRNSNEWRASIQVAGSPSDDFLRAAEPSLVFDSVRQGDARVFDLINKTNQFNLNGNRLAESDWSSFFKDPAAFLLTVSYADKYGRLGRIAVLMGKRIEHRVRVSIWVMSCRAFSRRVEHHCVQYLFENFGTDEIVFEYGATPRNGPLQEFFASLLHEPPTGEICLSRERFSRNAPPMFHHITEAVRV